MKYKIIVFFICMLMILTTFPALGNINEYYINIEENNIIIILCYFIGNYDNIVFTKRGEGADFQITIEPFALIYDIGDRRFYLAREGDIFNVYTYESSVRTFNGINHQKFYGEGSSWSITKN